MNIENEIQNILEKKAGNKEMALFYDGYNWIFSLGNPSNHVSLGEVEGEVETTGPTIESVVNEMLVKLSPAEKNCEPAFEDVEEISKFQTKSGVVEITTRYRLHRCPRTSKIFNKQRLNRTVSSEGWLTSDMVHEITNYLEAGCRGTPPQCLRD